MRLLSAKLVLSTCAVLGACVAAFAVLPRTSNAQAMLPRPRPFVSALDLECFRSTPQPPPVTALQIGHLNPVLTGMGIPSQVINLGPGQQMCPTVRKNNQQPPNDVLAILKYLDLYCYAATPAQPLPTYTLNLSQLNPAAGNIPAMNVNVGPIQQLCTPVAKNNQIPPPDIRRVVEQIDLACYAISTPVAVPSLTLLLSQLNPVLVPLIPSMTVQTTQPRQLCVPVTKNGLQPPADVTALIRWIDIEKFNTNLTAAPTVSLQLRHLNPLFANAAPFPIQMTAPAQLGLPVAKNGALPPL